MQLTVVEHAFRVLKSELLLRRCGTTTADGHRRT